jgi:ferredoxin
MFIYFKNGTLIKRPRIQYNPSKCDQCGDCVNSCPYNMLKITDNPKLPIAGFCTLCGQCIETCPEKALSYKLGVKHLFFFYFKPIQFYYITLIKNISPNLYKFNNSILHLMNL